MKKVVFLIFLFAFFFAFPTDEKESKVIYEKHSIEELSFNNNPLKVSLNSADTNVLVKLQETNMYTRENFPLRTDYQEYQASYYTSYNEACLNSMNIRYDRVYLSKYAPYIELTYFETSTLKMEEAIEELSTYDFVEQIIIQDDYSPALVTNMDPLNEIQNNTDGDTAPDPNSFAIPSYIDGSTIAVGVLDVGIVDTSLAVFDNANITVRDEWYFIETVSEHASAMAGIICGKRGYAKGVSLYSVQLAGNPVSEIDWLYSNNVTVVNVSITDTYGEYNSTASYFDYFAYKYGTTFVCASGNGGMEDQYVASFCMGYNTISVGEQAYTGSSASSAYLTPDSRVRPLIIAPGEFRPLGDGQEIAGTSCSAAYTSAMVALIQQYKPIIRPYPAIIRALIMANADQMTDRLIYLSNGFSLDCGVGLIDIEETFANIDNYRVFTNSKDINSTFFLGDIIFPLEPGDKCRFSMSYLMAMSDSSTPIGSIYALSFLNNADRIIYFDRSNENDAYAFGVHTTTSPAQYSLKVMLEGKKKIQASESICLAWNIKS